MSTTAICIGGPKDGETVTILHGSSFIPGPQPGPVPEALGGDTPETSPIQKTGIYRRERLHTDRGELTFWAHDTLDTHQAIEALLAGYGNRPANLLGDAPLSGENTRLLRRVLHPTGRTSGRMTLDDLGRLLDAARAEGRR